MHERLITNQTAQLAKILKDIKVVYTDLDNTLLGPKSSIFLTPDHEYSLEPARSLLRVIASGIDVVLVSGRNDSQLREISRLLSIKNYISELGCELFYGHDREIVTNYHYPVPKNKTLQEAIADSGAPSFLFKHFSGRLEYHTPWAKNQKCTHLFRGLIDVASANELLVSEGFKDLKIIDNGKSRTQGTLVPLPEIHVYHLLPKDTNKASAIIVDQTKRGFKREETISLGDSLADLEMADAVAAFFMVADGIANDHHLSEELLLRENAYLTTKKMGLGWAEVADLIMTNVMPID